MCLFFVRLKTTEPLKYEMKNRYQNNCWVKVHITGPN